MLTYSILITTGYASENPKSFEYGELEIIRMSIKDKGGKPEFTTTIHFIYGATNSISSIKTHTGYLGIEASNEAYRDFISQYSKKINIPDNLSEISILNVLGDDGWEIIYYSDAPAQFRNGTQPQSTYLLKRVK